MAKETKFCPDCCRQYPMDEYNCMCGLVFESSWDREDRLKTERLIKAGDALIRDVMKRYDLKKTSELTCHYMKELARSLKSIKKS